MPIPDLQNIRLLLQAFTLIFFKNKYMLLNMRVLVFATYELKKIDNDYFGE